MLAESGKIQICHTHRKLKAFAERVSGNFLRLKHQAAILLIIVLYRVEIIQLFRLRLCKLSLVINEQPVDRVGRLLIIAYCEE